MDAHNASYVSIYAAGPVDLGNDIPEWRSKLKETLNDIGIAATIFDPSTAYKTSRFGSEPTYPESDVYSRYRYIYNINKVALLSSDIVIASLPAGVQSVGTPIELHMAYDNNVPIILMSDIKRHTSVYLEMMVMSDMWFDLSDISSVALRVKDLVACGTNNKRIDGVTKVIGEL